MQWPEEKRTERQTMQWPEEKRTEKQTMQWPEEKRTEKQTMVNNKLQVVFTFGGKMLYEQTAPNVKQY